MKKIFQRIRMTALSEDDKKMIAIIRNAKKSSNPTYSKNKIIGLCRVSFSQTHDKPFKGNVEDLWQYTVT